VEPFYFGEAYQRLYGCHHLPQNSDTRRCAVVLCCPIGQEYIRSHRAMFQLAVQLSWAGFHVLRFDYFGCGDSEGGFVDGSVAQWTSDIHCAMGEIQERSGLKSISLVGLRIGATLALQAASNNRPVESIVLWEPIWDGRLHLKELAKTQENFLNALEGKTWRTGRSGIPDEIVGFAFTPQLKSDLAEIKPDNLKLSSDIKLLVLCNPGVSDCSSKIDQIRQTHPHADFHMIADYVVWVEELYKRLIPFDTIRHLVEWLGAVHS
jgi:pimeloyl-ACP methyl ester carboxylesterase